MERTINDCFKLKGLRNCCIDCLNYEPEVDRLLKCGKVENWITCAKSNSCYFMAIEQGGELYGR